MRTVLLALGASAGVALATDYRESLQGDLSDNRLAPSAITLTPGPNHVSGTFGPSAVQDVPDLDYLAFTVPAGWQLGRLMVTEADVGGAVAFLGLQRGATFTVPYTTRDPRPLLGWAHFGTSDAGSDLLRQIGDGAGAQKFTPPLPPGTYCLWLMELDGARVYSYAFELVLTRSADYDASGFIDSDDFVLFINDFQLGCTGPLAPDPACFAGADFDASSFIDSDDFIAFVRAFIAG